ncbi:hypothetical protein Hanom_Chr16g01450841 [Helianthus anomalus]
MVSSRDGIGTRLVPIPVPVPKIPVPKIPVPNLNKTGYQICTKYIGTGTSTGIFGTVPALVPFCFYLVFEHFYEY